MHSKVIIASLVCMMAATFGGNRIYDSAKTMRPKTDSASYCEAPNDDNIRVGLYSTVPYQNCDFCAFIQGIEYQSEMEQALRVIANPSNLGTYIGYNPAYGHYFNVAQPTTDGDYYASIGAFGKEVATIYIHRKNGVSYGSVLSKNDAREKYYLATNSSASIVRRAATQFQASNSSFTVVKDYCNYVYGSNDISSSVNVTSRPSGEANNGTTLKFRVVWQADGRTYPAKNIPFHIAIRGYELTPSTEKKTNYNGEYSVQLSSSTTSGLRLNEIGYAISTDTDVTKVLSDSGMNYPYYGKFSLNWSVSSYKTINFNITIYPSRSDRAAAYEITQAHQLLVGYARDYTNRTLNKIVTEYPSDTTAYSPDARNGNPVISIKKAHYHSWDVLNHEFSHYICDDADLCYIPSGNEGRPHRYNEDLSINFGTEIGAQMAYSEGLATFITIVGQIKNAVYSTNTFVNTIADYNYYDSINGVNVDYSLDKYGQPYSPHNRYVEASVTSVLLKLVYQAYNVGETNVWSAIMQAGWNGCTIESFLRELIILCPSRINDIYTIASSENIVVPDIEPNATAEWTIMIYMCGSTLEYGQLDGGHATDAIDNILHCPGQPSNVNIIIETGGCSHWCGDYGIPNDKLARYHVRNRHLYLDYTLDKYTGMGEQSTFESFLRWGLNMYPARKTGVIIWNHGGALEGVCQDVLDPGNTLLASETNNALKNIFREKNYSSNYRLEFIGYDACLMQVQDVADYNSNYFKYMVASEEEEVDFMWPYDKWVDDLYANVGADTETLLRAIVDSFVYENRYYGDAIKEQTLSVLDLSKMATYRQKFENLAQRIADCILDASLSDDEMMQRYNRFNMLATDAHQFGNIFSQSWGRHGTSDVYDFLNLLRRDEFFADDLYDVATDLMEFIYPEPIMSGNSNEGEDESLTFGPNARRTLILYKRANYVMHGHWNCHTYGLAMHVMIRDQNQTYPASETRFVKWRYLFTGLRDTIFSIIY